MYHFMFDVDGALIQSTNMDLNCYRCAVEEVLGIEVDSSWDSYSQVTDAGILYQILSDNNLCAHYSDVLVRVKCLFLNNLSLSLESNPLVEIPGAIKFMVELSFSESVVVSIATRGWRESAELKLLSAGFNLNNIFIASSNDSMSRTEIMKVAGNIMDRTTGLPVFYFGDEPWAERACEELGYQFVLVGGERGIQGYSSVEEFLPIE